MRRMILTSLVLIPVLANVVSAKAATEPKPLTSSVVLQAELKQPAGLAEVAMAAAAETPALVSTSAVSHPAILESVQTKYNGAFIEAALRMPGTIEYSFKGNAPLETSAPQVTRAVGIELSTQELSAAPAVSNVVLHAIVDEQGIPRSVGITKSAGKLVDERAIAAVNQYRFKPAMVDNQPTWAEVSITIKLQKQ
jgi:TonB family protein